MSEEIMPEYLDWQALLLITIFKLKLILKLTGQVVNLFFNSLTLNLLSIIFPLNTYFSLDLNAQIVQDIL